MVGISDLVRACVVAAVCARTGLDLSESLWLAANHTHAGPASFAAGPTLFAYAGLGRWYQPVVDVIIGSIADAVVASMDALEPAAVAVELDEDFDPDDRIAADRRCQDDPPRTKENRLWAARIDRADGTPLAVVLGLAAHGVVLGWDWQYSSDLLGWAEYMLQERYDRSVDVFALQTSAGDQNRSPRARRIAASPKWRLWATGSPTRRRRSWRRSRRAVP